MVPPLLRASFVVHFVADLLFAVPLFLAPEVVLRLFGWTHVDPLSARLVAAALFGIGIESWLGRNASVEVFRQMLNLKIIWSATATVGLVASMLTMAAPPPLGWAVVAIFGVFHLIWLGWRVRLGRAPVVATQG